MYRFLSQSLSFKHAKLMYNQPHCYDPETLYKRIVNLIHVANDVAISPDALLYYKPFFPN